MGVIPIISGALGTVTKCLVKGQEDLKINFSVVEKYSILFTQPLRSGGIWHEVNF